MDQSEEIVKLLTELLALQRETRVTQLEMQQSQQDSVLDQQKWSKRNLQLTEDSLDDQRRYNRKLLLPVIVMAIALALIPAIGMWTLLKP